MDPNAVCQKLLSEFDKYSECCVCTEQDDLVLFGCNEHGVCVKCYRSMICTKTARMIADWSSCTLPTVTVHCPMCRKATYVNIDVPGPLRFQSRRTHQLVDSCKHVLHEALGLPTPIKTAYCGSCQANFDDSKSFHEHAQFCVLSNPCLHSNCTKRTRNNFCAEHSAPPTGIRAPNPYPPADWNNITEPFITTSAAIVAAHPGPNAVEEAHSPAFEVSDPDGGGTNATVSTISVSARTGIIRQLPTPIGLDSRLNALFGQVGPIPNVNPALLSANAVMTEIDPAADRTASQLWFQRWRNMTTQEFAAIASQAFNHTDIPAFDVTDPSGGGTNATLPAISISARTGNTLLLPTSIDPADRAIQRAIQRALIERPIRRLTGWADSVLRVLDRLLTSNGAFIPITTIYGLQHITLDGRDPPVVYQRDDELAFLPHRGYARARAEFDAQCIDRPVGDFTWKSLCRSVMMSHLESARCDGLDGRVDTRRHVIPTVARLFVATSHTFPAIPTATLLALPGTIDTVYGLQHLRSAIASGSIIYHNYSTLAIVNIESLQLQSNFNLLCGLDRVEEADWKRACSRLRLPIDELDDDGYQHIQQIDSEQFFACLTS